MPDKLGDVSMKREYKEYSPSVSIPYLDFGHVSMKRE